MDDRKLARIIVERMKTAAGVDSQAKLAKALGMQPPSITDAMAKGKIPERWFDLMLEKYGATREELCRPPQKVSMSLEQNWGNAIQAEGCHTVNLNQGTAGQGITMQLSEREAMLIERLRIYGNQVVWAQIEAAIDKIEQASR
jgi:hypothetical protein